MKEDNPPHEERTDANENAAEVDPFSNAADPYFRGPVKLNRRRLATLSALAIPAVTLLGGCRTVSQKVACYPGDTSSTSCQSAYCRYFSNAIAVKGL